MRVSTIVLVIGILAVFTTVVYAHPSHNNNNNNNNKNNGWSSWGGDKFNSRSYDGPNNINADNAASLREISHLKLGRGVLATATTTGDGIFYFNDAAGILHAWSDGVDRLLFDVTAFLTQRDVPRITQIPYYSRSAPAIEGNSIVLGTLRGSYLLRINRFSGKLDWFVQLHQNPYSRLTASPRIHDGIVMIGVASGEDSIKASVPSYEFKFRGSAFGVSFSTGAILWETIPTVPVGYFGGSIWGSEAPIDQENGLAFFGTGNAYDMPESVKQCIGAYTANITRDLVLPERDPCRAAGDMSDSVIAVEYKTGIVRWNTSRSAVERWNVACGMRLPLVFTVIPRNYISCPDRPGPDADFGQAPILIKGKRGVTPDGKSMVVAGQKNGYVWGFDAVSGKLNWVTVAGRDSEGGGIMFGSTTNGANFFYATSNAGMKVHQLRDGRNITTGNVGSLRLIDGVINWETPLNCFLFAPLSHSNGVIYVPCGIIDRGIPGTGGELHILNAATGAILKSITGLPNRAAAVTIVKNKVMLTYGYTSLVAGGVITLGL